MDQEKYVKKIEDEALKKKYLEELTINTQEIKCCISELWRYDKFSLSLKLTANVQAWKKKNITRNQKYKMLYIRVKLGLVNMWRDISLNE